MNVIQSFPNLDWLSVWVKASAFVHTGDITLRPFKTEGISSLGRLLDFELV